MQIRANFNKRELVHSESLKWIKSPMVGVERRPLDRVGDEVARATSIVRYKPGSHFSPHVHTGGEEFLVLSGIFQDEHGDFTSGAYIRNPPTSRHTPGSKDGCVIFVKLWQFQLEDRNHVRKQLKDLRFLHTKTNALGDAEISEALLYQDDFECVKIIEIAPLSNYVLDTKKGIELLVIEGDLKEQDDVLTKHSWLRLPIGSALKSTAGASGARIWIKYDHLGDVNKQIERVQHA